MEKKKVIVIGGPTASGKSALALNLATTLGCEIFSADSRQLYRELEIGTAKPSVTELSLVQHHFINHISIHEAYSSSQYAIECRLELQKYFEQHDVAIIAGGTGFYLDMLLNGRDEVPDVLPDVSRDVELLFENLGIEGLQNHLKQLDPECYETIDLQNPRRLMRAVSVCLTTGQKYSSYLKKKKDVLPYEIYSFFLDVPRDILYNRINQRVDFMIEQGLKQEAMAFLPYRHLPSLETVGYREWYSGMDMGYTDLQVVDQIKTATRRYAKRQLTWFSKYGVWQRIDGLKSEGHIEQITQASFR